MGAFDIELFKNFYISRICLHDRGPATVAVARKL